MIRLIKRIESRRRDNKKLKKVELIVDKYGVNIKDTKGKFLPFWTAMQIVSEQWDIFNEEEKEQIHRIIY